MSRNLKKYISMLLMISMILTGAFPVYALPEESAPTSWDTLSPLPSGNKVKGVTIGGGTVVMVGEGGSVGTLTNSMTWALRNSGVVSDLNDVINIGSGATPKFFAVGDHGTVITSTNGTSWTTQDTDINENLNAIVYGGGRLVAVGDSGKVITSTDNGVNWSAPESGVTVNLNAVVYGDSKFVAVGNNGIIINFSEGSAWTTQTSGSDKNLNGVSFGGNVFVAAGATGEILSASNTLGTWTKGTSGVNSDFNSVSYNSNRFFIAGDAGKLLYSANGTANWSSISVAGTSDNLLKIKATEAGYYIIGSEGSMFFATSSTGGTSNWQKFSSPTPSALKTIVYADDTYITAGTDGLIGISTDGREWTKVVSGTTNAINGIAYGNGKVKTVGANGQILSSSDSGSSWSAETSGDTTTLNGIVYGQNRFVAVGDAGKIVTSSDGATWTKVSVSSLLSNLNAITYDKGMFAAVGSGGTILTSTDGLQWTSRVIPEYNKTLTGISAGRGMFVAVGVDGAVVTSGNGTRWSAGLTEPNLVKGTPQVNLNGVAYGTGVFIATGDGGNVFYSTTLGQSWIKQTSATTGTTHKLHGIADISGENRFMAVGDPGVMIVSNSFADLPRVIFQSPDLGEKDVEINADLSITFDQEMTAETGNIKIYKASDLSNPVQTIPVNDSDKVVIKDTVVTIKTDDFENGTNYVVNVDANAFQGGGGIGSAAIKGSEWSFTTIAKADTAAPVVESYSPDAGATDVAINPELVLTFDEPVAADNGTIWIYERSDDATKLADSILATNVDKVSIDGKTVKITLYSPLKYNANYFVNIDKDAFTDTSDNKNEYAGILDSTTWNFKTMEEPDTTTPKVANLSPAYGAPNVAKDANLVITFNENVKKGAGNIEIYDITNTIDPVEVIDVTSDHVTIDANNGKVVTIDPTLLQHSKTYFVKIDPGAFKDASDNDYEGITNSTTWLFAIIAAPPTVSTYSPEAGATGVAKDANLVLTFNKDVTKADGSIEIYNNANSNVVTIDVKSTEVTVTGSTVTINPAADLAFGTTYYVNIGAGAFKGAGAGGNVYAGISDSTTWSFTTIAAPDTTPPTVSIFAPAPEAEDVAVEADLILTFSEKVVAAAGNIVIFNSATNKPVASVLAKDVTILDKVVTINPAQNLDYATSYYVQIGSGAFKDLAGNSYAGINNAFWQFTTTAVPDRISPTVSTYSPQSWATEVAVNANLVLTFSENVTMADGSIQIYTSTDEVNPVMTIPAHSGNVTIEGNVVTINPTDNLEYGTSYFVNISEGAFKDLSGNSFAGISGITAWRFMTSSEPDTAAPFVTAFTPADNAVNVSVSSALSLTFNENVSAGNGSIVLMNAADDSVVTTIKADSAALVNISNATVTINTDGLLKQGESYYVVVQPDAFKDEAGNSFAGFADKSVWNFSIAVPVTPDPGTPAPGPGPAAPAPAAPSSSTETISAKVENGATQGGAVSSVDITRTKDANGVKKDVITLTSDLVIRAINELKAAGSNIARIMVPDAADEVAETRLTIPAASTKQFADNQISLDIFTVNAEVKVPGSSLAGFSPDIYFNLVPLKTQQQSAEAEARAKAQIQSVSPAGTTVTLAGRPITIETNLQSRPVTLVLPLNSTSLTAGQLQALAVFIEHSDGTKELVKGEIVPFGQTGKSGIQFNVSKFSTFTVVLAETPAVQVKAYMTGYADGTFQPGRSITRAEVASIIARTFNQPANTSGVAYSDIAAGHWAAQAIHQVSTSGIMKGYADGSFKPNQTITRAEMATILSRLVKNAQENAVTFSDIAGHWAQAAVEMTARAGIITGYEDGTFRPNQSLTRAEAVTIINRALGIAPLTSAAPKWTDVPAQYWAFGSIQAASVDHTAE